MDMNLSEMVDGWLMVPRGNGKEPTTRQEGDRARDDQGATGVSGQATRLGVHTCTTNRPEQSRIPHQGITARTSDNSRQHLPRFSVEPSMPRPQMRQRPETRPALDEASWTRFYDIYKKGFPHFANIFSADHVKNALIKALKEESVSLETVKGMGDIATLTEVQKKALKETTTQCYLLKRENSSSKVSELLVTKHEQTIAATGVARRESAMVSPPDSSKPDDVWLDLKGGDLTTPMRRDKYLGRAGGSSNDWKPVDSSRSARPRQALNSAAKNNATPALQGDFPKIPAFTDTFALTTDTNKTKSTGCSLASGEAGSSAQLCPLLPEPHGSRHVMAAVISSNRTSNDTREQSHQSHQAAVADSPASRLSPLAFCKQGTPLFPQGSFFRPINTQAEAAVTTTFAQGLNVQKAPESSGARPKHPQPVLGSGLACPKPVSPARRDVVPAISTGTLSQPITQTILEPDSVHLGDATEEQISKIVRNLKFLDPNIDEATCSGIKESINSMGLDKATIELDAGDTWREETRDASDRIQMEYIIQKSSHPVRIDTGIDAVNTPEVSTSKQGMEPAVYLVPANPSSQHSVRNSGFQAGQPMTGPSTKVSPQVPFQRPAESLTPPNSNAATKEQVKQIMKHLRGMINPFSNERAVPEALVTEIEQNFRQIPLSEKLIKEAACGDNAPLSEVLIAYQTVETGSPQLPSLDTQQHSVAPTDFGDFVQGREVIDGAVTTAGPFQHTGLLSSFYQDLLRAASNDVEIDGVGELPENSFTYLNWPTVSPQPFDQAQRAVATSGSNSSILTFSPVPGLKETDLSKFNLIKEYCGRELENEEISEAIRLGMEPDGEILRYIQNEKEVADQVRAFINNHKQEAINEASMWSLQPTLRAEHQDNFVPVSSNDTQLSISSFDELASLPQITDEQEEAFKALQRYYTTLTVEDLPELIKERFLNPLAVEILKDPNDYRHKYKAQEIYKDFTKQKELASGQKYRDSLIQTGAMTSAPFTHTLSTQAIAIKQRVFSSAEIRLSQQEFNSYCDGVEPEIIEKLGEEKFRKLLAGFLEMKRVMAEGTNYDIYLECISRGEMTREQLEALKANNPEHIEPTQLYPHDFHTLLNYNLVSEKEMGVIITNGASGALPIYKRLLMQAPIEGMNGAGLMNWGNTCWLNTGIQTMLKMISPDRIQQLRPQIDEGLERLRQSFQALMTQGQNIINGHQQPSLLTRIQSDFLEALLTCGQAGKLRGMNTWFNCTSIPEIQQQDSADFVSQLCELFGIYDDHSQSMERVIYYETTIGQDKFYKKKEGDVGQVTNILPCFRPITVSPQNIRMIDWFHSITEMEADTLRMVPWAPRDFHPAAGLEPVRNLPTREKCMMKIDPDSFKRTIIALNGQEGYRDLARQALLNGSRFENNELRLPVIDVRDNKEKIMVMRLSGAGLHRGTESCGHYIHMSLGSNGECDIQDDRIAQPFESYRHYLAEGGQMRSWQDLVEVMQLVPAYCEYEFVRFED